MKKLIKISLAVSLFAAMNTNAQNTRTVSGFHHVESVVADGGFIYAAEIGKDLKPSAKDGDGKVIKLDKKGQIVDANFVKEPLDAPKGLVINDDILYLNDIDRLVAIDLKTGNKLYEIDFSKDTSFLNDIAVWDNTTLFVSATDKSKLYKVNLADKTYTEVKTDKAIAGINGLFCFKKASRLYVNGFGSDNQPNGVIGFIDLKDNKFTQLSSIEGYYDGMFISKDVLYVSNWMATSEKKGIIAGIGIYNTNAPKIALVPTAEPIGGPADFIIMNDQLIVPALMGSEIHFIKLDSNFALKL